MKLLLAVDSVASGELLAASVAARPWASGTHARVLTVLDYTLIPVDLVNETGGQMKLIRPEMERRAQSVTARAVELLSQSGVEAEEDISTGDARTVILDTADEWSADLIFLRSHVSSDDITRWMLGSVAQEVLRRASCSVEIVRAATDDARIAAGAMRILLATDGSEYSLAAARSVSVRPWADGTEVKVISVVDAFVRSVEYAAPEVIEAGGMKEARAAVDEAVEIIRSSGLKTTGEVATGREKTEIVDRAKEWGASLVVVGSHGRRGMQRLLLGSVSEYVANHAHCSVEVIRNRSA
jgi:nucleotide-binding universal stress UspA family protein